MGWVGQLRRHSSVPALRAGRKRVFESVLSCFAEKRGTRIDGSFESVAWNKFCDEVSLDEAFEEMDVMARHGGVVTTDMLYRLLKECIAEKDLVVGRQVHHLAVRSGFESNKFVANHLIRMYACHGNLVEANQVFRKLPAPGIFVWTSIISGYVEHGQAKQAIQLYQKMKETKVQPNDYIFVAVLKACASAMDLASGKLVHADIVDGGFESNMYVRNTLVNMYVKCGSLTDARKVFDRLPRRDVVTWNALIGGYAQHGQGHEALRVYSKMQEDGIKPDSFTLVSLLMACRSIGAIQDGKRVHATIVERGLEADLFVGNALVDMYSKCGSLENARVVFDRLPTKDVVTWSAMIAGYAQQGLSQEALDLFEAMQKDGLTPANKVTFVAILKACARLGAITKGRQFHAQILERGLEADVFVSNSLVDMYVKCGSLLDARAVFDRLPRRDVVTWSAMVSGYAQRGFGQEALELFATMQQDGIRPDSRTYVSVLKACANFGAIQVGKRVHIEILERGLEGDMFVGNALVDMYAKCGSLEKARRVFDRLPTRDVATWSAMISGYAHQELGQEALQLFTMMQQCDMIQANDVTFASVLKACGSIGDIQEGKRIHSQIQALGLERDLLVGNSLVNMYISCGSMEDARAVFERLPTKDVVTWSSLIAGYVHNGLGQEALKLYKDMQCNGITPDKVTFVSILKACGSVGAILLGKQVHAEILAKGHEADVCVGNVLVDMYAKCGILVEVQRLFDRLPSRDVVTWTTLLNAYGQHNDCEMAMQCFEKMQEQGVKPNAATFTALLTACSHVGLVEEGQQYFNMMAEKHGIMPMVEHYTCMVDLLARSGRLSEAEDMLQSMPFTHDSVGWMSLLNACKIYGDAERARLCFDRLINLDPQHAAPYVLMSDIYTSARRWEEAGNIEHLRKCAGAENRPAKALIEVSNTVHEFMVGEDRPDTSAKLKSLNFLAKAEAAPHMEQLSDKERADALCGHAEKLALAYGLLNTPHGETLLIVKDLRMCNHCHSGTKIISRIERREIIVRDAHRVHHFINGACSCGDFC